MPQFARGLVQPAQERRVGAQALQLGRRHLAEQRDRVLAGCVPARRVDRREKVARLGVPGPAQVEGQLTQRGQRIRQGGADGEAADGSHRQSPCQQLIMKPAGQYAVVTVHSWRGTCPGATEWWPGSGHGQHLGEERQAHRTVPRHHDWIALCRNVFHQARQCWLCASGGAGPASFPRRSVARSSLPRSSVQFGGAPPSARAPSPPHSFLARQSGRKPLRPGPATLARQSGRPPLARGKNSPGEPAARRACQPSDWVAFTGDRTHSHPGHRARPGLRPPPGQGGRRRDFRGDRHRVPRGTRDARGRRTAARPGRRAVGPGPNARDGTRHRPVRRRGDGARRGAVAVPGRSLG